MPDRILVFAATGFSGRMVVEELARMGQPMVLAGRNLASLETLGSSLALSADTPLHVADVTRPETLPPLFEGDVRAVVNCAGPYLLLGDPVVEAAIAAGAHYLDLSGEQPFLARTIRRYDASAREKGCAVVPCCGVEFAVTNWAAALAARGLEPVDYLSTTFGWSAYHLSRGSMESMLLALSQPGIGWREGREVPYPPARETHPVKLPRPLGRRVALNAALGELVTIPRHVRVKTMDSYLGLPAPLAYLLRAFGPLLPTMSPLVSHLIGPLTPSPSPASVLRSRFAVLASAHSAVGRHRVLITGGQMYRLAATIVSWCARQTLEPRFVAKGVLGSAEAFDPLAAMEYLASAGMRCRGRFMGRQSE